MLPKEVYNYLKYTTGCTPCASINIGKYRYYLESIWKYPHNYDKIICTRYPAEINRDNWSELSYKIKHNYPIGKIPNTVESDWELSYYNEC